MKFSLIIVKLCINTFFKCPYDYYGYNCEGKCNSKCGVTERCDRVTGQCKGGYQVGGKDRPVIQVRCVSHSKNVEINFM